MKKTILRNVITGVALVLGTGVQAQDFHLTQYETSAIYFNPASTGMEIPMDMEYRISSNFRSQWGRIASRAYTTAVISYDVKFKNTWGIGGYISNNMVGQNNFRTLNAMLSGAYNVMHESDDHVLTVGLQLGLMNKAFNSSSYIYDSQYDYSSGMFDTGISSGEMLTKESIFRLDGGIGLYYAYQESQDKFRPYAGFSIWHITMPNESFTGQKARLPMRFSFNGGCDITIDDQWKVTPTFLFAYQAKANELNMGAMGNYQFSDEDYAAQFGLNYRLKDAFIVQGGMRYKTFFFRMSYDINLSYLTPYTRGQGGFELSLIYLGEFKSEMAKKFFH